MAEDKVKGYEIPIHRAITEQLLIGGVPRALAILNGTICAALVLSLHTLYVLPVNIIIHTVAVILTKRDPQFFDCFKRHIRQKNYYGT